MSLLDLPPELLQPILGFCTTTSSLQAAYSCKTLFSLLSSYRRGLLHHLSQLPGYTPELETKPNPELFLELRKRAASQLCGADMHADMDVYTFEGGPIDTRASAIRSWSAGNGPNVALVQKGSQRVCLYDLSSGKLTPYAVLEPVVMFPGKIEVLLIVFSDDGMVSVLQRYTPLEETERGGDEGGGDEHAANEGSNSGSSSSSQHFVEEAMRPYRKQSTQLVHYRRSPKSSRFSRVTISAFPAQDEYRPLALAVAHRYLAAISWQHKEDADRRMVVIHPAHPDSSLDKMKIAYQVYNDCPIIDDEGTMPYDNRYQRPRNTGDIEPIVQMSFNDNDSQLLYSYPSSPIYKHFQRINLDYGSVNQTSGLLRNICLVRYYPDMNRDELKFAIAIPFFSTHRTYHATPALEMCHWRYLSLGTAREGTDPRLVACLLRSEAHCRSAHCQHIENLDRGRRFIEWTVVARLAGFSMSDSSLPGIVATSPRSTRIAIANWKTISIWPLLPEAVIDGDTTGGSGVYYPQNMIDETTGVVALSPIVLRSEAVVFMLRFTEREDELVALTDRGVVRWDVGPRASGGRGEVLGVPPQVEVGEESESESESEEEMEGEEERDDGEDGSEMSVDEDEHEDEDEDEDEDDDDDDDEDEDEDEDMEDDSE
ncbi:hypothetical protein FQN55_004484 [Onygenales sp. PD_40]|nr:hypothetical protein FQN55_004484 [Onygenales sp. PD_40]